MRISYRRTSTINQSGERFKLDKTNYDLILFDKGVSGKIPFQEREKGSELVKLVQMGKVTELVVEELSRLGRNTIDVLTTLQYLEEHNVNVVVRNMGNLQSRVNGKKNPVWNLITSVMSSLYEMERENIRENISRGMQAAKRKGVRIGGSKLKITTEEVTALKKEGHSVAEIARQLKCSRQTVYAAMKRGGLPDA